MRVMQTHDVDCLLPDWPAPAGVRALFSCRDGGTSAGRYAGLNLGLHVGDDPVTVQSNRAQLQSSMGVQAVFLDQVHGTDMVEVVPGAPDAMRADGAYTVQSGVACAVMVADCLPVLLCDAQGRQVAAAHAGWRGLLGLQGRGVLESAVGSFDVGRRMVPGDSPHESLMAWLGPCIGRQAFEVGDEVRAAFVAQSANASACFQPFASGKWLANLPALARQRLQVMGVKRIYGNDGSQDWCTVTNPSRFFSHRRDGVSGRMAACIWRIN